MKRLNTTLLTIGLAMGLPMLAQADRAESSTYQFSYSAADLADTDRVVDLHSRIEAAAKAHCPSYFTARSISDTRSCVRDVTRDLVKRIDNPQLTAYAAGETAVELAAASPQG